MVRRFPWCTVVALVVLLFVTTEGLRERSTQIDDHKITSRGTLRYSKSQEESSTVPSLSRSRTTRERLSQSKRVLNLENRNEDSTLATVIASEPNFDSTKHSFVRTTRTTEIGSFPTAAETTNDLERSPPTQNVEKTKKVESSNRRNGKRYSSGSNDGAKSKDNEQKIPAELSKGFSRRTSNGRASDSGATDKLDNKGPSVFLATTESSRSRTGRKIQTTYSMKDLKTQIPTSRRFNNKKLDIAETTTVSFRREGRGRSTTERVERSTRSGRSKVNSRENNSITRRGPDALSESESIRVDIPLTIDGTQSSLLDSTTSSGVVAQRRSDAKELPRSGTRTGSERSKGRGRSNDSETAGSSRSSSRRGSSKFNDFTTTEANEQIVSSRKNTVSRDRARGSEAKKPTTESRSRSRGRNLENSIKSTASGSLERDVKRKSQERNSSDRRSRIPDATSRFSESRGQDTQDTRGRSRNRSRSDVTTPITTDVTTTVAPDTTVFNDVTTSNSEITSTTVTQATPMTTTSSPRPTRPPSSSTSTPESTGRGRGRGRGGSQGRKKEDFFNHGLGFRGRKPPPEGASNVPESRRTSPSKNDSQSHGNPGWTLRRRPGHFNNSENPPRNVIPSPRDQTNEVIPPNEQSTSTEAATTVESSTSSTRRGSKKLQTTEESSIMAETTTKSSRRGNKTFGPGKGAAELEESDNYPPEFKARLNQLKNTNTKTPAPKTTSRTPLEDQLKGNYGRRSRNNSKAFEPDDLETAASGNVLTDESLVMNPLTLINGTGLRRVKKSTAALFAERSRMKLELARRLVKPELNIEENDLDATTASSFSKPKPSGVPPVVGETSKVAKYSKPPTATGRRGFVESSREEASVKASKLSSSRKGLEDSSKVIGRPYNLKKGRIIAERMVTSISVEERAVDETTKPYVLTTKPSVITSASAEEGSATTIESTRIRLTGRERKKSKEEDSTTSDKNVKVSLQSNRRVENNDPVTTFKPKKPYVYQSRNSKLNSTSIEPSSTTIAPKKSYSPAERKSQTSQEENITKKSKFGSSASKPIFRPRYSKRTKQKSSEEKTADYQDTLTTKLPIPTSRYSRKKSVVKAVNAKSKSATTEGSVTQLKKLEFRPRTATYRRHSEVPTTLVESTTKVDGARVAITPRSTRFHATLKTSTISPQSVAQEPQVNLRIANESAQETPGITGSSNGDSGNTNIFNPTRSTFLTGNGTLLEQLRSTVAPLLSSLGNKTPVFSGSYSNVNNANSAPRVTPNGQPPRFSARYKGAELFIRKQNNVYQPTVPSITSSSTTPVTPVENSGSAPPVDVSSPGEPKFLTLYEALESVSIRNEQLQGNASAQQQGQAGRVPQVDSNAAIANRIGDNANNDTTSPTVATTSPQTPDTTANTIQDSTQTPSLPEDTENSTPTVTTGVPETPSTTEPVFTSTETSSSTEQASTTVSSTESPSSTEQVSTSTEMSSSSEQASTTVSSTESPSTTEQVSTSTDSLSTVQQTSTNSVPVTEQSSTESFAQTTSATTIGGPGDSQTSPPVDSSMNQEPVSSTDIPMVTSSAPEGSSTQVDEGISTTVSSTEVQSTEAQRVTGEVDVARKMQDSQNLILETTTATTTVSDNPTINTSENPETNTIPFSDATTTQVPTQALDVSSTDASTTESESSNMIEVETTTAIPTSTTRNRLIDFAQDILSRLQASLSTTTISNQDSTTTISPTTEISNVIPDSGGNSSLEALAQLTTETTTIQGESGTTQSSVTMDQSSLKTTEEVTTQSAVGSITTSSPTMVPTQEANTQDEMNAFTTTTPATITTSTQDSQTISNTDSTTVDDSNSTLSIPLGTEVTTASTITSTNDTLLTELMSIAKTLLSEEMNDTEQVITQQNSNDTSRLGNIMENEIDVLSTTQAAESSSIFPDVTTESVQSTPTTVAMSESSTSAVDPSQNEVDSTDPTTTVSSETSTDTSTTVAQNNMPDNETQSVQTTESTTIALGPRIQNLESTNPSFTTEIGPQITLSNRGSFDLDTTTQSQTTITTQSSETTTIPGVNFELTTNTFDLFPSNLTTTTETISEDVAENVTEPTGTIVPLTTVTSQLVTDTSTNQPEITTVETTPSLVNTITTTPSTSPEVNTEQTTVMPTTVELVQRINDVDVETNQTTTEFAQLTIESDNETLEATIPSTTASQDSMDDGVTTNQSPLISSTESTMGTTTNMPSETTVPQITPNFENETPTVVARFQDTTSATAQGTAGSGIGQTTEISTSMTSDSSTTPSSIPESSTSSSSPITTTSSVETTTATMTTETTTSTSIGRVPGGASMPQTTRMDVVTVTPMIETTTVSPDSTTTMSGLMSTQQDAMNNSMSVTTEGSTMSETTTMSTQTTPGISMPTSTMPPSSTSASQTSTPPYIGRFGSSRLTPAPRFSLSSTTRAPLRDYLVYGIYPNKTIVRKRPEDNLIDARNVDSPYVIFGIFPDGRLVRKFPNGTIISDPPRSPVEVVFSLSTSTTTNRPPPRPYYNQANQGTYNQYQGPVYNNNGRPVAVPMRNVQSPGTVDLGLTGNAIVGPNGGGPDNTGPLGTPGIPSTNEMSNVLLNTQMGTASVTPIVSTGRPPTDSQGGRIVQDRERDEATRTKEAGGQRSSVYIGQDKFVNYWTDGASTANPRVLSVNINSVAAGANEGPSTSVPSFENLLNNQPGGRVTAPPGFPWRDPLDQIFGITTSSPIMTASVASNRLDDSSGSNSPALTRPINPFVEVFTPFSSAIGVQRGNIGTLPPPPSTTTVTSTTSAPSTTTTTTMAPTTTTTTTMAPTTTTTTTMAPTTTTTTTMAPTTTTTTTMAPTTTTTTMASTTTTTTTMAPTTTTMASTTTTMAAPATIDQRANIASQTTASPETTPAASPQTTPFGIPKNLLNAQQQQQDAFGTTFDDLAFLNSLLQSNSRSTTQKTLTQVEQLLANKILSLALNNPGPTRAPKAINIENVSPNSLFQSATRSPSEPIVIDLSPSSTAAAPTWKSPEIERPTSQKSILNSLTSEQVTWKPVTTTTTKRDIEISTTSPSTTAKTTLISTTKVPVTVTTKRVTTQRPRTTTQAPLGFAGLLWQTLGGLFGPSTTSKPVKTPKPMKTTQKSVNITPKPIQTTQRLETITTTTPSTTTLRALDVSKIHVGTPNSIVQEERSVTTPVSISTTKRSLLNNPNPRLPSVVTSTYSPEEDAKFLVELLRAVQQENKSGAPKKTGPVQDDESFLRAILSGRALTTTPSPPTEISNAALLAALLKAQGIEPPTPAINIREQLQSASLGQSVTSAPAASPSSESTTITTRPASAATRPPDSTKKTVTPRPTSRPRIRTTTWSPSSTYPPPFFSSFSNYGTPAQSADSNDSGNGALFGATRAFSQFLGAAISGAAQQLQSLVRNGTRIVSEVVG